MDADDVAPASTPGGGLPALGSRGEGWVVLQVVLIGLVLAAGLKGPRWPNAGRLLRAAATVPLLVGGIALMAGGSRRLGRQLTPFPKPHAEGTLRRDGAYRLVRHPIYGGVLLLAWAWTLLSSPLAALPASAALPFLEAKRRREEAWLVEQHPEYDDYRRQAPRRFVPFVW